MITFFNNKREKKKKNRQSQQLPLLPGEEIRKRSSVPGEEIRKRSSIPGEEIRKRSSIDFIHDLQEDDNVTVYTTVKESGLETGYDSETTGNIYSRVADEQTGLHYADIDGSKSTVNKPPLPMTRLKSEGSNKTDDIYEKLTFDKSQPIPENDASHELVYAGTLVQSSSTGTVEDDDDPYDKLGAVHEQLNSPIYDFAVKPEPIYSKVTKPLKKMQ